MKRLLFFLIIFKSFLTFAEIDPAIVNMCENVAKTPSLATVMKNIYWPSVTPAPPYGGVVIGLTSDTNVIIDICNFVIGFEEMDTSQKINSSKQFVNTLTARKFQDDFDFVDKTMNIANSVYDFENGERRPGFLANEQSHREFNEYLRDLNEYRMNKQMSEAERKEVDAAYTSQIEMFAKLAQKNANIESAINCPDSSNNPKYSKLYNETIRPEETIRQFAVQDIEYFKEKLEELGQFMYSGDYGEYKYFYSEIKKIEEMGHYLNVTEGSYTKDTYKPSKTRKDKNGKPIQEKKVLIKKYQIFDVKMHPEIFSSFKEKHAKRWKDAVKWEYLKKSSEFGVLAGADERVENTFRNYTYECSERRLMEGYDQEKPDYAFVFEKKQKNCLDNNNVDEKKIENLFTFYSTEFQNALYKEKKALSKIWTFESRWLGTTRFITKQSDNGNFLTENVKCSDHLTPAEMEKLSLKQEEINNEMKEIIAKNKIKKNLNREEKKKNEQQFAKENQRKKSLVDEKNKELKKSEQINGGLIPPRSGIGPKK